MRRLLDPIRSILFNIAFFGFTLLFTGLYVLPSGIIGGREVVRNSVYAYCAGCAWLARWVMGIKVEFRGVEKLPKTGGLILAAAHQSNFDPMLVDMLRRDVTALAKKELFRVPIIGQILKKLGAVRIDRNKGDAHREMAEVGRFIREEGLVMIVYPQATRVRPGTRKKLKAGAYHLARDTGLPVYTAATTTGLCWTRGFWHRSGTVVFEVVREISHLKEKDAFMAALEEDVVLKSEAIAEEMGYGDWLVKPKRVAAPETSSAKGTGSEKPS